MEEALTPKTITMQALKLAKREIIYKFATSIGARALLMVIPILFGFAVDSISKGDYSHAYFMALLSVGVYIVYRSIDIVNTYTWHKLYNKLYQSYTSVGLQTTYNNSLFSLSRISTGEYINIMNNDIGIMCDFYCNLPTRIVRVCEFIVIFIYFFFINVFIGAAGVLVSAIAFLILYISSKQIQILNQKRAAELDKKSSVIHEILLCIKEIKGFNIFGPIRSRLMKSSDNYVEAILKQRVVEDAYKFGIVLLIEIFRLGLFIYGIYLISQGKMALGALLVIYNYYAQLIDNFSDFATINANYRNLIVSENRFNKILEYSMQKGPRNQLNNHHTGNITFNNILYGYKDNPTLNHVSFYIKTGELTCIVGDAGSGKNGVIDLLLKFNRQHDGEVLIDHTDINQVNETEYHDLVSYTSNETTFFNMSIKDNLSIIEDDFERIVDVCKRLGIHEYIIRLKDGYDTMMAANGANFDLNVKQLLGVARVLIKNPKIMLFDEIFSTLNAQDNTTVLNILESIKNDHTIVIFTKDCNILEKSDKVIFLGNNRVLDINTHSVLLKENDAYKITISK